MVQARSHSILTLEQCRAFSCLRVRRNSRAGYPVGGRHRGTFPSLPVVSPRWPPLPLHGQVFERQRHHPFGRLRIQRADRASESRWPCRLRGIIRDAAFFERRLLCRSLSPNPSSRPAAFGQIICFPCRKMASWFSLEAVSRLSRNSLGSTVLERFSAPSAPRASNWPHPVFRPTEQPSHTP